MDVKFLNPFLDAVSDVLVAETNTSVTRGKLTLQNSALTTDDVTVLINLVGQIQGVVLYGFPIPTCLALVSRMMGQQFTSFDNLAQSGVAELGNVISGRATVKLAEAKFTSNISTPTLVIGKGVQISTLDFARITVPVTTGIGDFTVHLALRESPAGYSGSNFVPLAIPSSNGQKR